MYEEVRSRRLLPESGVCSGRSLSEVHCRALKSMASGVGGCPGSRPWSCGDHAGVLAAPAGGMVAPVEGTVPCT